LKEAIEDPAAKIKSQLAKTDAGMARVVEDKIAERQALKGQI